MRQKRRHVTASSTCHTLRRVDGKIVVLEKTKTFYRITAFITHLLQMRNNSTHINAAHHASTLGRRGWLCATMRSANEMLVEVFAADVSARVTRLNNTYITLRRNRMHKRHHPHVARPCAAMLLLTRSSSSPFNTRLFVLCWRVCVAHLLHLLACLPACLCASRRHHTHPHPARRLDSRLVPYKQNSLTTHHARASPATN
jgi:hypothetical protein